MHVYVTTRMEDDEMTKTTKTVKKTKKTTQTTEEKVTAVVRTLAPQGKGERRKTRFLLGIAGLDSTTIDRLVPDVETVVPDRLGTYRKTETVERWLERERQADDKAWTKERDVAGLKMKTPPAKKLKGSAGSKMRRLQEGARMELEAKYGSFEKFESIERSRERKRAKRETERLGDWLKKMKVMGRVV